MFFGRQHQALQLRREALVARSAMLRHRLGAQARTLAPPLATADRLHQGWQQLRANPQWLGLGLGLVPVLVLLAWRPRRGLRSVLRLGRWGWAGWFWWAWGRRWLRG